MIISIKRLRYLCLLFLVFTARGLAEEHVDGAVEFSVKGTKVSFRSDVSESELRAGIDEICSKVIHLFLANNQDRKSATIAFLPVSADYKNIVEERLSDILATEGKKQNFRILPPKEVREQLLRQIAHEQLLEGIVDQDTVAVLGKQLGAQVVVGVSLVVVREADFVELELKFAPWDVELGTRIAAQGADRAVVRVLRVKPPSPGVIESYGGMILVVLMIILALIILRYILHFKGNEDYLKRWEVALGVFVILVIVFLVSERGEMTSDIEPVKSEVEKVEKAREAREARLPIRLYARNHAGELRETTEFREGEMIHFGFELSEFSYVWILWLDADGGVTEIMPFGACLENDMGAGELIVPDPETLTMGTSLPFSWPVSVTGNRLRSVEKVRVILTSSKLCPYPRPERFIGEGEGRYGIVDKKAWDSVVSADNVLTYGEVIFSVKK